MKPLHKVVLLNAIIWAVVILTIGVILKDSEYLGRIIIILGGGHFATLIILYGIIKEKK